MTHYFRRRNNFWRKSSKMRQCRLSGPFKELSDEFEPAIAILVKWHVFKGSLEQTKIV